MNNTVWALVFYQGDLFAGGAFRTADDHSAERIARWDGRHWQPLGAGITGGNLPCVAALALHNDELIAAGRFATAGGGPAAYWACWSGVEPPACPGDTNCDGAFSYADIDRFVEALAGESAWAHTLCPWRNADCNGDGAVTFADIDPFVALIGTTCP
jgi:hypothetical protein